MRRCGNGLLVCLLTLGVSLALTPFSFAQESFVASTAVPKDAAAGGLVTIQKRVDEVNLVFTVVDPKGHFVSKLQLADFDLLDAHKRPERIDAFEQESEMPLRVALLIDESGSVSSQFRFEQSAASTFLKNILRPAVDKACIFGFNRKTDLKQDFTGDVEKLREGVHRLHPDGETALYDAIVKASEHLRRNSEPGTRRVIILISDGEDNQSHSLMRDAQDAAVRAEAPIYALSTNDLIGEYPKGEAVLELLTRYTGGQLLPANSGIVNSFRQIEKALRNQYVLSYKPADMESDGSFREISLTAKTNKMKVKCRHGYYAPRN